MRNIEIPEMNTMIDCTNHLVKQGYTENFQVVNEKLKALSDDSLFDTSQIAIPNFFRFESQSDPSDNSIIYVIETNEGKRGMLIDAYGLSADIEINEFIKLVEDFQKKVV